VVNNKVRDHPSVFSIKLDADMVGNFGFFIMTIKKKFYVVTIDPDGHAAKSGLKLGWLL